MNALTEQLLNAPQGMVAGLPRLGEPRTALALARHDRSDALREALEAFVRDRFHQTYGAKVATFCPDLLSLSDGDQSLRAVAGVRPAATERLYSEFYLDAEVEVFLAGRLGCSGIPRASVVEVGNLAPASVGQARWLIATLTAYLYSCGYEWVVFTAIPSVYNAFTRLGLSLQIYTRADITRLPTGVRDQWGSYYEAGPVVCYGNIAQGFRQLSGAIRPERRNLWSLWLEAQRLGNEVASAALPLAVGAR
jgi:hypothetical protein